MAGEKVPLVDPELEFAVAAVKSAGAILLRYYRKSYTIRQKSRNNPVTPADLAADTYLREAFNREFPEDGWLSEETADSPRRLGLRRIWVVDPLDGTKEFVKGLPEFAVSVALVEESEPKLAVIYNPARDELFTGAKGKGAYRDRHSIRVSAHIVLQGARVFVSRSERSKHLFDRLQQSTSVKSLGSIAYKLALIAASEADLSISVRPKNEWDVCAGVLLVQEAGGRVTDLKGETLSFNRRVPLIEGIVAGNPILHEHALEWLEQQLEAEPLQTEREFKKTD